MGRRVTAVKATRPLARAAPLCENPIDTERSIRTQQKGDPHVWSHRRSAPRLRRRAVTRMCRGAQRRSAPYVAFVLAPVRPVPVLRATQPGIRRRRAGRPRRCGAGQRLGAGGQRDFALVDRRQRRRPLHPLQRQHRRQAPADRQRSRRTHRRGLQRGHRLRGVQRHRVGFRPLHFCHRGGHGSGLEPGGRAHTGGRRRRQLGWGRRLQGARHRQHGSG